MDRTKEWIIGSGLIVIAIIGTYWFEMANGISGQLLPSAIPVIAEVFLLYWLNQLFHLENNFLSRTVFLIGLIEFITTALQGLVLFPFHMAAYWGLIAYLVLYTISFKLYYHQSATKAVGMSILLALLMSITTLIVAVAFGLL